MSGGKKKLSATITIGGTVSNTLNSAIGKTKTAMNALGKTTRTLTREQNELGSSIKKMSAAGHDVDLMRYRYTRLGEQIDKTKRAQDRLTAAAARSARLNKIGGTMMRGGAIATGAGAAIGATVMMPGINEAKHWQSERGKIAALGMSDKTNREAAKFAQEMKTYGTSKVDNITLLRDAMSVFADLHHAQMVAPTLAKMKFGNEAVFGSEAGAENEAKFLDMLKVIELRGGTASKEAFNNQANMVQKVISATGGRVGPSEWRHLIATGGLAAKSMRDDAFYYQLEPLVQEMGGDRVGTGLMSGYSSLYQGRTTKRAVGNLEKLGLIGDKSKVEHDKSGQIAHLNVGAIKGADVFRKSQYEWMKTVLIPTLAEKGLTSKDEILDAIGSIFSSRKGADIMAAMYLQTAQIDKNEKLNRGAADINRLDEIGRGSVGGKEIAAEKNLADLKLKLGTNILPLYTGALETANAALEKLNGFVERNPKLSNAMAIGIGGIGVALMIAGPLVTAGGALVTAYSSAQLLAATRATMATTAIEGQTIALAANGVASRSAAGGLLAFAKRAAIVIGLANAADYAAGQFGVGKGKVNQKQDDANWGRMNWWQKGESGFLRGVEGTGRMLGMGNFANQAQADRVAAETRYLGGRKPGRTPPALPNAGRGPLAPAKGDTNTFHIYTPPGSKPEDVGKAVVKQWADRRKGLESSALYDAPKGQ